DYYCAAWDNSLSCPFF
nr:immunoglobulin light chain junction region [Macaca mulatta]MOX20155.1 immunoglobulin light chain junction region [Macaca mulatta]MOX23247.1 immunoglobulin light chain junction region [Macaca mulatta]